MALWFSAGFVVLWIVPALGRPGRDVSPFLVPVAASGACLPIPGWRIVRFGFRLVGTGSAIDSAAMAVPAASGFLEGPWLLRSGSSARVAHLSSLRNHARNRPGVVALAAPWSSTPSAHLVHALMNSGDRTQESVWDYPRPPRIEPSSRRVRVLFADMVLVDSEKAVRVLETSHPPVYYVPLDDVRREFLSPSHRRTFCEFKGTASYVDLVAGERRSPQAGWFYENPSPGFEQLGGMIAFYPSRVDFCLVDDEVVRPQEGDFYGGWITSDITGPFKGGPGTSGW